MTFGAAHFGHFHAETGGRVEILSSYTVNGGAPAHLEAVLGGQIIYLETAITVTVTGTPNFSSAFVDLSVNSLAYVNASFITFSGAATGALYRLRDNSSIETVSGVPTNFPGNALGVISRGGVFNPPLDPFLTAVSGLGTGGTAIISATTPAGAVQLNTGASGAAATGTFTINLREAAPSGIAASFTGSVGSQFWNAAATFLCGGGTNSSVTVNWNNNGIALTASSTYYVQYQITPY
jgi:hypothetical protein